MPDQLSREEFEKVAREVAATAPPNLTREQFEQFVVTNVRAKQYEGQENAGSQYLTDMAGGAWDRVKDIGRGLAGNIQHGLDMTYGNAPLPGALDGVRDFASGVKSAVVDTPSRILDAVNTDDPRQAGGAAVDAAMYIPGIIGLNRATPAPVQNAVKNAASKVTPGRAVDVGLAMMSSHPVRNTVTALRGQGATTRVIDKLFQGAEVPSNPNAGGTLRAPSLEGTLAEEISKSIDGMSGRAAGPGPAPNTAAGHLDDMAASPARAGAATEFTRPNPNAGGTLRAPSLEASVAGEMNRSIDQMQRAPISPADEAVNTVRSAQQTQSRLGEQAASPARAGATTDFTRQPNPNAGGRLVPGVVAPQSVEAALTQELQGMMRPMPAHSAPAPTPAKVADPGSARRPATTSTSERAEAQARTNVQNARVGGGAVPAVVSAPSKTTTPTSKTASPAAAPSNLPTASKSKGATKISENDMKVFVESVQKGMTQEQAVAEMLHQRAERHATKYSEAQAAAAARRAEAELAATMRRGSH